MESESIKKAFLTKGYHLSDDDVKKLKDQGYDNADVINVMTDDDVKRSV